MLILKYLAILKAKRIEGLYRPFSKDPIVCRDTSSAEAKSSCLIPFSFRNSSKRFFKISPFLWKVYFPHFHYIKIRLNVKRTFHCTPINYLIIFQLLSLCGINTYILSSSCPPFTENKKLCQEPATKGGAFTIDLGFLLFCIFRKEEKDCLFLRLSSFSYLL